MAKEIRVPELGENVEQAEVLSVLVGEGDEIKADQPILELETDKATFEMPCPQAGVVKAIRVAQGDVVEVGQVVLELEEAEAADAESDEEDAGEETGKREPEKSGDEGDRGEREQGEEKQSEEEGRAEEAEGEGADAEEAEGEGADGEEADGEEEAEGEEKPEDEPTDERGADRRAAKRSASQRERGRRRRDGAEARRSSLPLPAAPSVRRLARELGIPLEEVRGSGPKGRIASEDVTRHARELLQGALAGGRRTPGIPRLPDFARFGEVEREPLSGIRRRTAENMARSWLAIPHVTQHDRADVTELERSRRQLAERAESAGTRLTLTAIVVKVAAAALRVFPRFNASIDLERDEAIYRKYVNVGVAVDTEWGLLAPVIRDADRRSLLEIATALEELSDRARRRKATREDLEGSGFTVTNLGGLGTTTFAPLVQWPEVAVLGVGRASEELRPGRDGPETRLLLPLSISYDHRWIDGADAARFLRWIAEALEHPLRLALGA